ncbi:MAG: SIR2 family NAD-dependent protein deacylase [Planctomycetaceae bacterium]
MLAQVVSLLSAAPRWVAFTGAGISTESGIPDFRSPGGIWQQVQPVLFQDFLRSADARNEYWRQKARQHRDFSHARPNVGHAVLARWEARRRLVAVVTQNIDELHQQAGSRRVIELHGTARQVECLACGQAWPVETALGWYDREQRAPDCPSCGGPVKHATISFGQGLNPATLSAATEVMGECDLVLVLGSSLVVQPAAGFPVLAQSHGARLVIINNQPTPLDRQADVVLRSPLGETLAQLDSLLFPEAGPPAPVAG